MNNPLSEFTEIEKYLVHAPNVKELGDKPYPKDLYAAYVKVVLKAGDTLSESVDKRVVQAMKDDGLSVERIANALTFSPNLEGMSEDKIINDFIRPLLPSYVLGEYDIDKYLHGILKYEFRTNPFTKDYHIEDYYRHAKLVLMPGEIITPDIDKKIICSIANEMARARANPSLIIREVSNILQYSPNYREKNIKDIRNLVSNTLNPNRKKYILMGSVVAVIWIIYDLVVPYFK